MKLRRKVLIGILTVAATAAAVFSPAAAVAAVETTIYAAPSGTGSSCSSLSPCSLATAKSTAESLAPTASGDIDVVLQSGTYALSSSLTFTTADQAANGYRVSYAAAAGANVVFSGGSAVTGWTLHDSGLNIWSASIPSGTSTRQIYVNGVRADIDTARTSSVFGTLTKTSTGYTYSSSGPDSWSQTADVDLVYTGSQDQSSAWAQSICPATSIGSGVITMADPCWSLGTAGVTNDPNTDTLLTLGIPSAVENNYALLAQPGQFYIDSAADELYYIPRAGETMSTANVIVPTLQTLLEVDGTHASPVSNLTFSGISFEYATWTFGDQGVLDVQGNNIWTTNAQLQRILPPNVSCEGCDSVAFVGDTFTHLGGAGLGLDGGGSNNLVRGNVFTDISSNGIQLGEGVLPEPAAIEDGDRVTDNYVHDVATEYLGGIGIFSGWVTGTVIEHNEVWNVPYIGISLGWGWGVGTSDMADNHIDYNYVHDVMNSSLSDGGAIYVNGIQGSSPGSTMEGNYVGYSSQDYAALYLDNGASNWTVSDNVVGGYAPHWLYVQQNSPVANYNTVTDNIAGSLAGTKMETVDGTNSISGNADGMTYWPTAAQTIIAGAGLESDFLSLQGSGPQSDLAFGKPVTVSSSWPGLSSANTTDGNDQTEWSTNSGDTGPFWQTDLGGEYPLSDVQIQYRLDGYDSASDATNVAVVVSNSSNLAYGYTAICDPMTVPMPAESRVDCPVPSGSWQYVSVLKTDGTPLVFSEVRVFGHDANLAEGQPVYATSTYSGSYPASNANDGDPSTLFASTAASGQFWTVALSAASTLTQARITFRSDGYDNPSERENFEVRVSNSTSFATYTVACSVGATPLPYAGTYTCTLPPGPWQYVELAKTDSAAIVVGEVQILGHE